LENSKNLHLAYQNDSIDLTKVCETYLTQETDSVSNTNYGWEETELNRKFSSWFLYLIVILRDIEGIHNGCVGRIMLLLSCEFRKVLLHSHVYNGGDEINLHAR
jgi:hypothetical protein